MLPALFLLCVLLSGVSAGKQSPTYEHRDPTTGQRLNCTMCPPGTHLAAHCTATTPTKCSPCGEEHYTALWNYLPKCLYCNNLCFRNLEVETECSPVSNRVCRCKQGFFMTHDRCVRHRECKPGSGVKTEGTPLTNTVCETCSEGYFSNSSSAQDSCVKHQDCANGQLVLLPGFISHDTVCGSCDDFTKAGESFKAFMSGIFNSCKVRSTEMRRFANRYIKFARKRGTVGLARIRKQRGPLLDMIISLLSQDPEHLKEFPLMLRGSALNHLADMLEMRLKQLREQLTNKSSCENNILGLI